MKKCLSIFWLFVGFFTCTGLAESLVELHEGQTSYILGKSIHYLEDRSGKWTLGDVQTPDKKTLFKLSKMSHPGFGYTGSAYWVRFSVLNTTDNKRPLYLELAHPFMKHISFFLLKDDQLIDEWVAGVSVSPDEVALSHRNHLFPLNLAPKSRYDILMRFENDGPMGLPLTIWDRTSFHKKAELELLMLGVFYGVVLVLLIYNIPIYISLKDKSYLLYILFLVFILIYQLTVDGLGYQFFWGGNRWLSQNSAVISWNLVVAFYCLFASSFLGARQVVPKLNYGLIALAAACVFNALYSQLGNPLLSVKIIYLLHSATVLLAVCATLICMVKRQRSAYFYFFAMVFLIGGSVANMMKNAGILPAQFFTTWGIHLGTSLEILLLSIGLADRINTIQKEKHLALEQVKVGDQQRIVVEKTAQAKSEFLANVTHELRTPMQSILGYSELGISRINQLNVENIVLYFKEIYTSAVRQMKLIDNLLDLSKLEANKEVFIFQQESMPLVIKLVVNELFTNLTEKNIQMNTHLPDGDANAVIDADKIAQVIRNLIGNAINFSDQEGDINIRLTSDDTTLVCSVEDNGIGIPEDELETIFGRFEQSRSSKKSKKGTGLGLAISRKIVEGHGGKIWAENRPLGGASVTFQIPKMQPVAL